jgi:NAD(P)H-hydrate epimerase
MTATGLPDSLYTAEQVRALDRIAIESRGISGLTLMRRAAEACVDTLIERWGEAKTVNVYCGSGNNAGDGYIVAGLLAEKKLDTKAIVVGDVNKLSADATAAYDFCKASAAKIVSVSEVEEIGDGIDVIVDALLGTGAEGEVRSSYRQVIESINASGTPVLAVDIPAGLSADTGGVLGIAIRADVTVTFIALKQGLFTLDGPDHVGDLEFSSLGVPEDIYAEVESNCDRLGFGNLIKKFGRRRRNSHKNDFGHVLVAGGDVGMGGAVAMAAEAALRAGAGLVSVATHPEHTALVMSRRPELMVYGVRNEGELDSLLEKATVLVLGPGLGKSDWSDLVFEKVISSDLPSVVDADGLNHLAGKSISKGNWILTPHPGEAKRLLKGKTPDDRFAIVRSIQRQYGGVVVLKGVGSLLQSESRTSLCPYGNPGMSTAGMGDVLSGVIGGLLAQGCNPSFAAQLGVVVHALAADQNVETSGIRGLIATDLLPGIRRLLNDS